MTLPQDTVEELGTIAGQSPAVRASAVSAIPAFGTGLKGFAFAPGDSIRSLSELEDVIAANPADARFTAFELDFASRDSTTTLNEFLADNGEVTAGNGNIEMGPSGLVVLGFVYIPPGEHTISVYSDDGYAMNIGGAFFSSFDGRRGAEKSSYSADFEGGLYPIEIAYFDAGGQMALRLDIDGIPVDQSAFYANIDDFRNPPEGTPILDAEDYHPSLTLGELTIDDPENIVGTNRADLLEGAGGDDTIEGRGGDDRIYGGYDDDILRGGNGHDLLDGGFGSDLLIGGNGDDILVARSDGGEQRIAQRYVIPETRPEGPYVNPDADKLAGYEDQPLIGDDILVGGNGSDTFLIASQLNGILPVLEKHTRSDGSINWAGVAGENDYQHLHWVDSTGFDLIADYDAEEDHIAVIGHTANVFVDHVDYDNDGVTESIITTVSLQHGGGGAHDRDLIGVVFVEGDLVDVDDIKTDNGVTYGVVEGFDDVAQAINQQGDSKTLTERGVTYDGYDYRGAGEFNKAPEGDATDLMDNPYWDLAQQFITGPTAPPDVELTRDPFDQLGFTDAAGQTKNGTNGADLIAPDTPPAPNGLPGALGIWQLGTGVQGRYNDMRGELGDVRAYDLYERQAVLRTDDTEAGPRPSMRALSFDGEDDFAYLAHNEAFQVSQGTIALWVRADDLSDDGAIITKDESGRGDGGHFRLIQLEDGKLHLRFAPGDGGANQAWTTSDAVLEEGVWTHLAVNFTADGLTVFKNGAAINDTRWTSEEGDVATPGAYQEAYLLRNEEPFVLGADQSRTDINDTAQVFATDASNLRDPFEGAMAEFGIWGGMSQGDALTVGEIRNLMQNGPGNAVTNPSGPQAMVASDDTFFGDGGNDTINGEGGNDILRGGDGNDVIHGGYGDDRIQGGNGNDTVNGGRGSDFVRGGNGDDVLIGGGDVGEDRAGQLVLDEPSRPFPDASIDDALLKLVDWVDQPLYADDIFLGGAGRDHMMVQTYINGKKDILLDNVIEGTREINWHGVAGENARIHDHWVDGFGIDIFGDFNADEDRISIIGHTTNVEISYSAVDTDGDGTDDSVMSVIRAYSQQGNNGGAHDEDELGLLLVIGDMVTEDMVETHPHAHLGIVETIDELQEAVAPSDDPSRISRPDDVFGYDDRDVAGRPLTSDPMAYSVNPFMNQAEDLFDWQAPGDGQQIEVVNTHSGGSYNGTSFDVMLHTSAEQQNAGTYLLSFRAYDPGNGDQALLSKDFSGFGNGGHLTMWINSNGDLKVRFQSETSERTLTYRDEIVTSEEYDIAFSYSPEKIDLFVNGELADTDEGFRDGMLGNDHSTVIGASVRSRTDNADNISWQFDGEISNVAVLDTDISILEAVLLAGNGNDPTILGATEREPETVRMEVGNITADQPDGDTWVRVNFSEEIPDAVVVMGPLEHNGANDAVVRVQNVTSTGFEFKIEEWNYLDGEHLAESVSWMAISEGTHELITGQTISAGSARSKQLYKNNVDVALEGFEDTPAVFTQVASYNGSQTVISRIKSVDENGFRFSLQEQEDSDDLHNPERVDWIAIDGDIGDLFDLSEVNGGLTHQHKVHAFETVDSDAVVFASMQSFNGTDTASLRFRDLGTNEVSIAITEEQSADRERIHLAEDVAVLTGSEGAYDLILV